MTTIQKFADAMANVGAAVEASFERQQVEYVLGLTGGELEKLPLVFSDPNKTWGDTKLRKWTYHYTGVPSWAEHDFENPSMGGYCTLVEIGISYESSAPDEMVFSDGDRWFKVMSYTHSGENECPLGSCGNDETVGQDETDGFAQCPLCEADAGEKHGYIYLGHTLEIVYRKAEFSCAECNVTQDCDCEEKACA